MGTTVKVLKPIADAVAARGKTNPGDINLADGLEHFDENGDG
jgi:hypothetical protein